jgi:hypothetical protein
MHLVRLIYASRPASPFGIREMVELLEACRHCNEKQDITGMLAFSHEGFLQVLEGGAANVNRLYHRIAIDPRHDQLSLLAFSEVAEREFPDWSMAALDVVGLDARRRAATLMQFGTSAVFDPFTMNATSALRLMIAWRTEVVTGAGPAARLPPGATPPAG